MRRRVANLHGATSALRSLRGRWDFVGAIAVGAISVLLATKHAIREDSVTVLLAAGAAGLAILGVVLAAMAIIAPFVDSHYRRVLDHAGGVRSALAPYLLVAGVGALTAIVALVAALAWPTGGWLLQAVLDGLTMGLAAYAILGALSLVELTIFHADQRAKLQRGVEDAASPIHASRLSENKD